MLDRFISTASSRSCTNWVISTAVMSMLTSYDVLLALLAGFSGKPRFGLHWQNDVHVPIRAALGIPAKATAARTEDCSLWVLAGVPAATTADEALAWHG